MKKTSELISFFIITNLRIHFHVKISLLMLLRRTYIQSDIKNAKEFRKKRLLYIPTAPAHMSQAAHFLLTVMSLQFSLVVAFIVDFDTYYLYLLLLIEGYCY